ncbi:UDP-galactose translocator-like isoform X2 [Tubulanus polymorphus]|uniref:UDP-galactose translocator-like isoform X2 n=1 Tax=Tubulanus polymorphus TaxID=672921 RepID=UPI003DA5A5A0
MKDSIRSSSSGKSDRNSQMEFKLPTAGSAQLLKYVSLVLLTLQNAALILLMRYVRTRTGDMFKSSTAVIMSETIKFTTCLVIILFQEGSARAWLRHLYQNTICQPWDCLKISVPSIVYVLQNNLLYVAVSNLDAATFQVTYQLKLLTTAIFSVVMLRKSLTKMQWFALMILFVGISIVQLQPTIAKPTSQTSAEESVKQSPLLGLVAVLASCVMSGFAGVYFEKILKGTVQSLWLRNVQLGFLGVIFGLVTMELNDGAAVHDKGFFFGYNYLVWCVIFLQSFGGLMVAVVVKYADNILKGFATSAAIVISCIASMYFFDFIISLQFVIGASLVMSSVYMYSRFATVSKPQKLSSIMNGMSKS